MTSLNPIPEIAKVPHNKVGCGPTRVANTGGRHGEISWTKGSAGQGPSDEHRNNELELASGSRRVDDSMIDGPALKVSCLGNSRTIELKEGLHDLAQASGDCVQAYFFFMYIFSSAREITESMVYYPARASSYLSGELLDLNDDPSAALFS
ncbi:hypothetical protein HGRIS_010374 [Hohenbuehelia grisea]|uniref:Uncharacterized protein n=1 Tax=Hohenbuehelia grisea TaxID=104357 RepID=A0ABR3J4J0_9AGAR